MSRVGCGLFEHTWFRVIKDASRTVLLDLQKFIRPYVSESTWALLDMFMAVMEKLQMEFFKMLTESQTASIESY